MEKLELFARFAEPELRRICADLALPRGAIVLDVGCGAGLVTQWLAESAPESRVVGIDLSAPHLRHARAHHATLVQCDAAHPCFRDGSVDFIWSCNTINHLADPVAALERLGRLLKPAGRVALVQSGFLPDMFFAWDAPLEDAVRAGCHRAYRERYGLDVRDTAGVRGLVGLLMAAGFERVTAHTCVIERTQPLRAADRDYLQIAIFDGTWGDKVHRHLGSAELERLRRNCDPASPDYCLERADFHHLQSLTVCTARRRPVN